MAAGNGACTGAEFTGTRADGSPWVYLETIGGGGGARPTADGLSGIHVHMTNTSNLPVEALELEYPLSLLRYELVDGSGGAGTHRGGMGMRRVYRAEAECRISLEGSRIHSAPWGLDGGLPGGTSSFDFGDGTRSAIGTVLLRPGQVVTIVTPGAGGHGEPAGRDPDAIQRDVREGRITREAAEQTYGRSLEPAA